MSSPIGPPALCPPNSAGSPDRTRRAGGTRTPNHRFWRPGLWPIELLPCASNTVCLLHIPCFTPRQRQPITGMLPQRQRGCPEPRFHKYTPAAGLPELRQAIAAKTARDSGYQVEASQVLVTNGGKQAVYQAFATLLDPGDEVIVPAPYWTTYPEAIALAGGVMVPVRTDEHSGYLASVEDLEAARSARSKVLLFVSPSNPTGAVYSPDQVRQIGEWAAAHGLWVVTDEIYEHLVYGGATFSSIPVQAPETANTCVVLNGVAKTYAMTGWRVGWMIGPRDVISAEPQGAFYCYPSVKGLLGIQIAGQRPQTSAELAGLILDEAEVAVVPGEAFGTPGYFRLSCALGDADLEEGISRMAKLLAEAR